MDDKRYKKLTLLHSNDMHGDFLEENVSNELVGGVAMLSGYISKVKAEEKNVLYCIAGDMFRGSVIDSEYLGYSTIEIMNMLAPDVVTIGNHETDYGLSHLLFMEKCAKFPIINANLYIKVNGTRLFRPYIIIEIDGMKILFIGILTEEVMSAAANEKVIGSLVDISDAAKEVEKICNAFSGTDIDFTVLLTHIGFENDKKLAASLDPALGVDVIIGGHSHTFMDEPYKVNDILIVQAGTGTDQIGRFDIIVDTDTNSVESYKWQAVPITASTCPNDEKMLELISELKSSTDLKYGRTLRRLNCELKHESRYKQTTLGNFISDIYKNISKCDLFLTTSGSVRVNSLGPIITLKDMMNAVPFENEIYEIKVTGKQLKDMIVYVCRDEVWQGDAHEFYQVSYGWNMVYDQSLKKMTTFKYNGKDVEDEEIISLGLLSFDFNNIKTFFGIDLSEVEKNGRARIVSTDSKDSLYEYIELSNDIPEYPAKDDRLIVKFTNES